MNQKAYSLINISGLTVGLVCAIWMILFVKNELNYDKHYPESEKLFRVVLNERGPYAPLGMATVMMEEFPEVESATRFNGPFDASVFYNGEALKQEGRFYADSNFFQVFGLELIAGNKNTALSNPNSVILTESVAEKWFPKADPMDKMIEIDGVQMMVTGIIADAPKTTHMPYEFITPIPSEWLRYIFWTGNNFFTYVRLNSAGSYQSVNEKFPQLVAKYVGPEIIEYSGHSSFDAFLAEGNNYSFEVVPVADIHLKYPTLDRNSPGSMDNIKLFSAITLFVLFLACINFMNLSTARSSQRSKEVGLRKVMGSQRHHILVQFLAESIIICLVSFVLAFTLSAVLLPLFNQLAGRSFIWGDLFSVEMVVLFLTVALATGFLAGSYPAFYMSGFKPITALKGLIKSGGPNVIMRKGLVIFQFAISMGLILATAVIYKQLMFMTSQNPGLNTEQTLVLKNIEQLDNPDILKSELGKISGVEKMSFSNHYPSGGVSNWTYRRKDDSNVAFNPDNIFSDHSFSDVYDLKLISGRFFEEGRTSDTAAVIINKQFADEMISSNPLEVELSRGEGKDFRIIGIVENFNTRSMKREVRPMIFRYQDVYQGMVSLNYLTLKTNGNQREIINNIENVWKSQFDDVSFEYLFVDESFRNLYKSEEDFATLFSIFSSVAIFIACIGLIGLATFTLRQRLKEITIRKVLGARMVDLSKLLLTDFSKWIIAGISIGLPVSYFLMEEWLSEFATRVGIDWMVMVLPAIALLFICWLIIFSLLVKVSGSNPTEVLSED